MTLPKGLIIRRGTGLALLTALLALAGCGGNATPANNSSSNGTTSTTVNDMQSVEVNLGPANNYVNGLFTDVTFCVHGTTTCQTVSNMLVDTGSEGVRVLASQLSLSLPAVTDSSNNPLQECLGFADGSFLWGQVETADIQIAGETAMSVPLQVVTAPGSGIPVPSSCSSGGGVNEGTVDGLGANGILGIGNFRQDCGVACSAASSQVPSLYFLCPNSACQVTSVPLADQLQNPVWLFAQDNNGLLISLPSVSAGGAQTVSGSLIFGIGTQSNNAFGAAQVYATDANGDFQTTFQNVAYSQSFIDSGSNALYFLDSTTVGIPNCSVNSGFYCPGSTVNYTATTAGLNGTSASISFSIANADALFSGNNAAFNNLGGDNAGSFDWGLPFFYGRNVFIGIEGQAGPGGAVGPYWAY